MTESSDTREGAMRYVQIDALRAFVMILIVVFHAAMFLVPGDLTVSAGGPSGVPVSADSAEAVSLRPLGEYSIGNLFIPSRHQPIGIDAQASFDLPYDEMYYLIWGFAIQVFFLLGGFLTASQWRLRGLREMAASRWKRVGIPLVVLLFTLNPLQMWLWWTLLSDGVLLQGWQWLAFPFLWIVTMQHLWFLWVLLLFVTVFAATVKAMPGEPASKFTDRRIWWLLIPLSAIPQFYMTENRLGPDMGTGLLPHPLAFVYFLAFFFCGAVMYQIGATFRRWWTLAVALAVAVWELTPANGLGRSVYHGLVPEAGLALLKVAFAWCMCFGLMGLFTTLAGGMGRWGRYLADASYTIYLGHLVVMVLLRALADQLDLSVHLEFGGVVIISTAVMLVVYHFGVRGTRIGEILSGSRSERSPSQMVPA